VYSRRLLALVFLLLVGGGAASPQILTLQQDRRIEEEKREELKPTIEAGAPPTVPSRAALQPPVPIPIPALYLAGLLRQRIVFRYDALKALVVLMDVDEEYIDLNAQVAYAQAQGFLPKHKAKAFDPMQPLRRGEAAYLFHRALGIKGGLALHLLGPTERYALKELAFQGFLSGGRVNDLVSGEEFVQLVTQAVESLSAREAKPRP